MSVSTEVRDILGRVDIDELFKHRRKVDILVCGILATGKSALINSFVGKPKTRESDPAEVDPSKAFLPGTPKVQRIEITVQGTTIVLWDSPGLQGGSANEEAYLEEMERKCRNVDLVLFCMDMTVTRWTTQLIQVTKQLTKKFGDQFWRKCVLVMTKTNLVTVPPRYRGQEHKYHKQRYDNYLQKFRQQLVEQTVPRQVAEAIPGVAAGYNTQAEGLKERYLWYISAQAENSDMQQDFLPELWHTCLEKTSGLPRSNFPGSLAPRPPEHRSFFSDYCIIL